jgi:hypothetical protein
MYINIATSSDCEDISFLWLFGVSRLSISCTSALKLRSRSSIHTFFCVISLSFLQGQYCLLCDTTVLFQTPPIRLNTISAIDLATTRLNCFLVFRLDPSCFDPLKYRSSTRDWLVFSNSHQQLPAKSSTYQFLPGLYLHNAHRIN